MLCWFSGHQIQVRMIAAICVVSRWPSHPAQVVNIVQPLPHTGTAHGQCRLGSPHYCSLGRGAAESNGARLDVFS